VGVGFWAARRTRNGKDFFIAGQSLGLVVTGLATMSAAFSGFVFIGGPGLTYRLGLAALFICAPVSFTAGLLCWSVGKRLRLLAEVREVYTIPDAILLRYGSRRAAGLAALAVLLGTIAYLGAQLQALGVVIEAVFGTREIFGEASLAVAMGIGLAVVVFYAVAGGMLAGAYTDLVQGALMVVAAVGIFVAALRSGGGLAAITERIVADESFGPRFLDPLGNVPVFTAVGFFFIFAVGTLGQPHMLHKFYMLKDPRKLRWMPLVVGGSQLLCVLVWLGIGLAVPALVASGRLAPLADPDHATPVFLLELAPPLLAGLVFAGVLAAIMSSADSFLNIGAAALVRDLPQALGLPQPSQLAWGRRAVIGVAFAAALFSLAYGDLIALLGTFAFSTFGAALAPALAIGLHWKRVTARAATASIATGLTLNIVLEFLARQTYFPSWPQAPLPTGVLPGVVSLAASFCVLLTLSWANRSSQRLPEDVQAVMDC
jgi:Na+/proline symporter